MKTSIVFITIFAFASGFPRRQTDGVVSLFQEWRDLINKLPVGDVLKNAAVDEVDDLFFRLIAEKEKRERGLIIDFLTFGLDDDVKTEFEDSVTSFAENTGNWFKHKVKPVSVHVVVNISQKLKDAAIALKNKVQEYVGGDDNDDDSTEVPMMNDASTENTKKQG